MKEASKIVIISLAMLVLGAAFSIPTFAQDRPCAADAKRLCQQVEPGNRQAIAQCLREHVDDLSEACRDRIQAAKAQGGAQHAGRYVRHAQAMSRPSAKV